MYDFRLRLRDVCSVARATHSAGITGAWPAQAAAPDYQRHSFEHCSVDAGIRDCDC